MVEFNRANNGKVQINLPKMSLNESIEIVKTSAQMYKKEWDNASVSWNTYATYNGEEGYFSVSDKQKPMWDSIPLHSRVRITKSAKEIDTPKGKKVISNYIFEPIGSFSGQPTSFSTTQNPATTVSFDDVTPTPMPVLTDKQKKVLNYYNMMNPKNKDAQIQYDGKVTKISDIIPGVYL